MTNYTQLPTMVSRRRVATHIDIEGTRNGNPLRLEIETFHDRERKVFITNLIRQDCEMANGRIVVINHDLDGDLFKLGWGHVARYSDKALREFHQAVLADMDDYKTLAPVQRLFRDGDDVLSAEEAAAQAEAAGGDELYEASRAARHRSYRES